MTIACGVTWDAMPSPIQIRKSRFRINGSDNVQKLGSLYPSIGKSATITSILDLSVQYLRKRLEDLKLLHDDWDGYGAPAISHKAIKNCSFVLSCIKPELCSRIQILPNQWGGVQLQFNTKNGQVCCDYGDETMSYFVEYADNRIEWHSYESYNEANIEIFTESLISVR